MEEIIGSVAYAEYKDQRYSLYRLIFTSEKLFNGGDVPTGRAADFVAGFTGDDALKNALDKDIVVYGNGDVAPDAITQNSNSWNTLAVT